MLSHSAWPHRVSPSTTLVLTRGTTSLAHAQSEESGIEPGQIATITGSFVSFAGQDPDHYDTDHTELDSEADESEIKKGLLRDQWRQFFDKFDPEGFGEIPWPDFLNVMDQPEFRERVNTGKRLIFMEKSRTATTPAITFQDFVNVIIRNSLLFINMVVSHGHGPSSHGHGPSVQAQYKPVSKSEKERRVSYNLGRLQGRESFLTSTISIFVDENQPLIPDGGWGWLVMLGSFFINLVSDGITCCFGLLFINFLHEFEASKSATSWIGSLYVAVPLVGGPIASALVDKYGCKKMTIVGALISTVGFILSTYARNIVFMYLTFGFLGGVGLALCYVTAVVAIAFWFDTKRTLALGLAAAGCGFGTVLYSPLITILSSEYGWRGTVLVLAGLFANMCVCGLLQRDPDWIINQEKDRLAQEKKEREAIDNKEWQKKVREVQFVLDRVNTSVGVNNKERFHSVVHLPTYISEHKEVPLEVLKNLSNDKHLYKIILENYPNLLSSKSHSDTGPDKLAAEASLVTTRVPVNYSMTVTPKKEPNGTFLPLTKSSNHPSNGQLQFGYLANIKLKKHSVDVDAALLNMHQYKSTASCPEDIWKDEIPIYNKNKSLTIEAEEVPEKDQKWYHNFMKTFGDVFDFSLFRELHFFLVSIATILMCIWFAVPFVYLADHMKIMGHTDYQASLTISVLGITNILGMVIIGFLGTRMKVATLYAACLFLSGACCAAMMLFSGNFYVLLISSGAFGLFYACQHSLTPALIALLVPLDKFSMAYGLSLLCQGIGKLTGPPLAGYLYDVTRSYSQSFYQAAIWISVAGILIGIIPFTKERKLFGR